MSHFKIHQNDAIKDNSLLILLLGSNVANIIPQQEKYCLGASSDQFNHLVQTVIQIGDGIKGFTLEDMREFIPFYAAGANKITIFSFVHGVFEEGKHFVLLDDKKDEFLDEIYTSTEAYFTTIAELVQQKKIELFSVSCHGGGAVKDVNLLPKGSTLITLSPEDSPTHQLDLCSNTLEDYLQRLHSNFTIQDFLSFYLLTQHRFDHIPIVSIAGETEDYFGDYGSFLGKSISIETKEYVLTHFGRHALEMNFVSSEKLDSLIKKIENSHTLNDFTSWMPLKPFYVPFYESMNDNLILREGAILQKYVSPNGLFDVFLREDSYQFQKTALSSIEKKFEELVTGNKNSYNLFDLSEIAMDIRMVPMSKETSDQTIYSYLREDLILTDKKDVPYPELGIVVGILQDIHDYMLTHCVVSSILPWESERDLSFC